MYEFGKSLLACLALILGTLDVLLFGSFCILDGETKFTLSRTVRLFERNDGYSLILGREFWCMFVLNLRNRWQREFSYFDIAFLSDLAFLYW